MNCGNQKKEKNDPHREGLPYFFHPLSLLLFLGFFSQDVLKPCVLKQIQIEHRHSGKKSRAGINSLDFRVPCSETFFTLCSLDQLPDFADYA
jgi:hypothetical protein